jgi:hypothetical protein
MNAQAIKVVQGPTLTKDQMKDILLKHGRSESNFKVDDEIVANNRMDKGVYKYELSEPIGKFDRSEFNPVYSPQEMLEQGVFEGRYLNDCILEFPKEWFETALADGKLSPEETDVRCNRFKIKSRQSLKVWKENGWIYGDDNRGWFQWYCRYWLGRREPETDEKQIKRWKAFKRHYGQVAKNCPDINCRPKQRQALLQWSWDADVVNEVGVPPVRKRTPKGHQSTSRS